MKKIGAKKKPPPPEKVNSLCRAISKRKEFLDFWARRGKSPSALPEEILPKKGANEKDPKIYGGPRRAS